MLSRINQVPSSYNKTVFLSFVLISCCPRQCLIVMMENNVNIIFTVSSLGFFSLHISETNLHKAYLIWIKFVLSNIVKFLQKWVIKALDASPGLFCFYFSLPKVLLNFKIFHWSGGLFFSLVWQQLFCFICF
jgi:hypothetical protein